MTPQDQFIAFIARLCLVLIFPFSALNKIFDHPSTMAQASQGLDTAADFDGGAVAGARRHTRGLRPAADARMGSLRAALSLNPGRE